MPSYAPLWFSPFPQPPISSNMIDSHETGPERSLREPSSNTKRYLHKVFTCSRCHPPAFSPLSPFGNFPSDFDMFMFTLHYQGVWDFVNGFRVKAYI